MGTAVGPVVGIIVGGVVLVLVLVVLIVPWARRRSREARTALKDVEQASSSPVLHSTADEHWVSTVLITSKQDASDIARQKAPPSQDGAHDSQASQVRSSYDRDSITKSLDRSSAWDHTSTMSGDSSLSNVRLVTANEVMRRPLQLAVARSMEDLPRASTDLSQPETPSPSPPTSYPTKPFPSERAVGLQRMKAGLPPSPMEPLIERRESSQSGSTNAPEPPSQLPPRPNPALLAPSQALLNTDMASPASTVPSHRLISAFEGSLLTSNPSVSSTVRSQIDSLLTNESSAACHPLQSTSSPRSSYGTTAATSPPVTAKTVRPELEDQVPFASVLRSPEDQAPFASVLRSPEDQAPFTSALRSPEDQTPFASVLRSPEAIQMFLQAQDYETWPFRSSIPSMAPHVLAIPSPPPYPPPTTPLPPTPKALRATPSLMMVPVRSRSDSGTKLRPISLASCEPEQPSVSASPSSNATVKGTGALTHPLDTDTSGSDHDSITSLKLPPPPPLPIIRPLSSPPSRRPSGPRRPPKRGRDAPFPVALKSSDSLPLTTYASGGECERTLSPPPRIPSFPPLTPLSIRAIMVALEHEPMPELRLDYDRQVEAASRPDSVKGLVLPSICTLSTLSLGRATPDLNLPQEKSSFAVHAQECESSRSEPETLSRCVVEKDYGETSTPDPPVTEEPLPLASSRPASFRPRWKDISPSVADPESAPIPPIGRRHQSLLPPIAHQSPAPSRPVSQDSFYTGDLRNSTPSTSSAWDLLSLPEPSSTERPQLAIETSFLDSQLENVRLAWLRPPSPLRVAKRPRPVSDMVYPVNSF